jgi:malate synthase
VPDGVGRRTIAGSRTAARVTTLYRYGVLSGRGASLIEGYMEDLATDRIYRLMLAQRTAHHREAPVLDENGQGGTVPHTPELVTRLYDEELESLRAGLGKDLDPHLLKRARAQSEQMVVNGWHDPV